MHFVTMMMLMMMMLMTATWSISSQPLPIMCKPTTFSSGPTQTSFITFYDLGDGDSYGDYDGGDCNDNGGDNGNDNTVCCFLVVKAWYIGVNLV